MNIQIEFSQIGSRYLAKPVGDVDGLGGWVKGSAYIGNGLWPVKRAEIRASSA